MEFLIYVIVKAGAYIGWSVLGARLHGHSDRLPLKGLLYGVLRLLLGATLGLIAILTLVNAFWEVAPRSVPVYLVVYVPVRWIEWSLLAVIMDTDRRSLRNFAIGLTRRSRLWRLGGIVISCLADLPLIIGLNGLPVGRFMC